MINTIEINWELLGAKLATLSDEEQGKFFHGFASELRHYESEHKIQMQMFFIADKITEKDKKTLEDALSCLWYKEK